MRGERSKRTASKAGTRPRRVRLCGRRREGSGCGLGAGRATHGVLPPARPPLRTFRGNVPTPPTRQPANLPTCKPANLQTCQPATPRPRGRKKGPPGSRRSGRPLEEKPWRRATLPRPIAAVPSPLGPFTSVFGMGTGVASPPWPPGKRDGRRERPDNRTGPVAPKRRWGKNAQASRTISTGRVSASPRLRLRPIEVVVFHRP